MNGILPLWKPKGLTSHDCVMKIRKLFQTKKVGHTGTLDPEVEGVLPVCVGQATKIVPFLTDTKKTYIAEVTLGATTDTEDSTGKIIEEKAVTKPISEHEVVRVLNSFQGIIMQTPPMYSAVKVNGKKLYEYARANQPVKRPQREVTIHYIELLSSENEQGNAFRFKVTCSKGTYIRTLCVDIGKQLGYPAHMSALFRTATGSFKEKDSITFDKIEEADPGKREKFLLPMTRGLVHLDSLYVDEKTRNKILHGQ